MNNMMVSELQPQSYVMEVEEAARVMRHNFGAPDSIVVDPPYYNYIILYDRPIQQWRAWLSSRSYCLNMHCVSSLASISMDGWLVMNTQEVKFLSQMSHILTQWCTKGRWSPLDIHLASKLEVASNQKISNERQNWGGGSDLHKGGGPEHLFQSRSYPGHLHLCIDIQVFWVHKGTRTSVHVRLV